MAAHAAAEPAVRLFPRQMRFVKSAAPFPAFIGGIGSGKSFSGAAKVLTRIAQPELGMVAAPAYPMLRDATQRTILGLLREVGVPFELHKSENRITIPASGHEILFRSLDDPESVRGPNLHYAWIDEASLVSHEAWQIVKGRVRVGAHPQVWITATPKGRNWLWDAYERDATGNEFDPVHPLYRVRTEENPELPDGFAQSLGYSGRFALQELGGEFVAFEGLVYDLFARSRHVRTVDCRGWGAVLGVDAGVRNPTAILTIRYSGESRHIQREIYRRGMGSREMVAAVEAEADACHAEAIYCDPSAAALIADLYADGYPAVKANNAVMDGIREVTALFGADLLSIDPGCVNTIAEHETYAYPDNRRDTDSPVKANDHACDAERYALMGLAAGGDFASW